MNTPTRILGVSALALIFGTMTYSQNPVSLATRAFKSEAPSSLEINEGPNFQHNRLKSLIGTVTHHEDGTKSFAYDPMKLAVYLEKSPVDQRKAGMDLLRQMQKEDGDRLRRKAEGRRDNDGEKEVDAYDRAFNRVSQSVQHSEEVASKYKFRSAMRRMRRMLQKKFVTKEEAETARTTHHPNLKIPANYDHNFYAGNGGVMRGMNEDFFHYARFANVMGPELREVFNLDSFGNFVVENKTGGENGVESLGGGFSYSYAPVYFGPLDYVDNMDELWATIYAPFGTEYIEIDFDYIDLEPGFDELIIYDQYGECDSFTGSHGSFRMSTTCVGDYVDFWIETDGSISGDRYDGFSSNGIWHREGYDPPVAIASANNYSPRAQENVYFYGDLSFDPEFSSSYLTYYWTFGDGTTSRSRNPVKDYNVQGLYQVNLQVCNSFTDLCDNDSFWIDVQLGFADAYFYFSNNPIGQDNAAWVHLSSWNQATSIQIDWGDNTVQNIPNYTHSSSGGSYDHRYQSGGFFTVVVTASNSLGTDVYSRILEVVEGGIPPTISQTARSFDKMGRSQNRKYLAPLFETQFEDDGTIESYQINWGSGFANSVESFSRSVLRASYRDYATRERYTVGRSHDYRDPQTGKNRAGVYHITGTATDNSNVSSSVSYSFATKNKAPKISGKAIAQVCTPDIQAGTQTCDFSVSQALPFERLFKDKDGEVVNYTFELFTKVGRDLIPYTACAPTNSAPLTCTFPLPTQEKIFVYLTGTDNFGATASKKKKVKLLKKLPRQQ